MSDIVLARVLVTTPWAITTVAAVALFIVADGDPSKREAYSVGVMVGVLDFVLSVGMHVAWFATITFRG